MAKSEADPLMPPADLKLLLLLAKKAPVSCAVGLTRDKAAILLLDKKVQPRKLLTLMRKQATAQQQDLDAASCRFGQALIRGDDTGTVQFVVNKEPPGALRPKLLEQLKKAGFARCEFSVDEALDAAAEDAPEAAPSDDASDPTGDQTGDPAGTIDPAALTHRLIEAVRRTKDVLAANPAAADAMRTAAVTGQSALRAGDHRLAAAAADTLERLLAAVPAALLSTPTPIPPPSGPGSPVFGKARATWLATRRKVENELDRLHEKLQQTYKGHGVVADLETVFRARVEPMMAQFDETLAEKLDEVSRAVDPAAHAGLVAEARQIIARYEGYLANEPLIDKLDTNPFVPLAIERTLLASLTALSKAVT